MNSRYYIITCGYATRENIVSGVCSALIYDLTLKQTNILYLLCIGNLFCSLDCGSCNLHGGNRKLGILSFDPKNFVNLMSTVFSPKWIIINVVLCSCIHLFHINDGLYNVHCTHFLSLKHCWLSIACHFGMKNHKVIIKEYQAVSDSQALLGTFIYF